MIRIQLNLDPARESLYEEAISRLRDVELTDCDGDALVAGDIAAARSSPLPCLLDQPESCAQEDFAPLTAARLMPAHAWRFLPAVLPVHESKANGQLGEPGLLRIHHWLSEDLPPERAAFAQVDLAHWFFGASPARSHFLARPHYLQIHLGYPGDGMALIDVATNRPGSESYYSMHLVGSTGAAYADDHRNAHLLFDRGGSRALLHRQDQLLATRNLLHEFLAGIHEDRAWSVDMRDTVKALTTIKEATDA